jgi:hypothetical protein
LQRDDGAAGQPSRKVRRHHAAHENSFQRRWQVARDVEELVQLFCVDEQEVHCRIDQKIGEVLRFVEIGYDDRDCAEPNRAQPERHVVEAVGAKQEKALFGRESEAGKRRCIARYLTGQFCVSDRLVSTDDSRFGGNWRVLVTVDQIAHRIERLRNVGVTPLAPFV